MGKTSSTWTNKPGCPYAEGFAEHLLISVKGVGIEHL
jgi:hypothetical protein